MGPQRIGTTHQPQPSLHLQAHNKLDEALYASGTDLAGRNEWCALDLGAAPGGWTALLAGQVR